MDGGDTQLNAQTYEKLTFSVKTVGKSSVAYHVGVLLGIK